MGLDSVELLMEIEQAFDIRIPNAEAEQVVTVGDLYETVWRHLGNRSMPRRDMESFIRQIIADKVGLDLEKITPEKSLANDLGLD